MISEFFCCRTELAASGIDTLEKRADGFVGYDSLGTLVEVAPAVFKLVAQGRKEAAAKVIVEGGDVALADILCNGKGRGAGGLDIHES